MQSYLGTVTSRFALLNSTLARTLAFSDDEVIARLTKIEQSTTLLKHYPDQLRAVFSALEFVRKNSKQQGARLYICFVVFEKIQQSLLQRRAEIQEDLSKVEQLLAQMNLSAVFQTQIGPLEQRQQEHQRTLRMLEIFEEQVVKARRLIRESELTANQLILNSEQASLVIFKAMEIHMPIDSIKGMIHELDQICEKVVTLKTCIDRLEAQVNQALAESNRMNLTLPNLM